MKKDIKVESGRSFGPGRLSPAAREALELIRTHRYPDPSHPGVAELQERRIIEAVLVEGPEGVPWIIADPRTLERCHLGSALESLISQAQTIAAIPDAYEELEQLIRGRDGNIKGIQYLASEGEANASITKAMAYASKRVLTVHPGRTPRKRADLEARLPQDLIHAAVVGEWKEIYSRNHRADEKLKWWAAQVSEKGVQIRTTHEDVERVYIIDDAAMILDTTKPTEDRSAWLIQIPALVSWMEIYFRHLWKRSERWIGEGPAAREGALTTEHSRRILRLYTDDLRKTEVAKALGVSSRYIDKHLEELYRGTGIKTLHGLVLWFSQSEERHINP
ncbi:hypothetical protein ACH4SP_14885 [Streptomyces sp. NPDC021093]|uniref:hypothetical protein n=1 Tax=Streptomyces sp. NPDC021093 TaxID=3365112 RepID=UPI0037B8B7BC